MRPPAKPAGDFSVTLRRGQDALGEMQNGSTQKIGVGYHLPSAPHQLMLHTPLVQLRTDEGTVQADTGFAFAIFFFAANEGVADTVIAPAASVAANTHFAIVLIMVAPAPVRTESGLHKAPFPTSSRIPHPAIFSRVFWRSATLQIGKDQSFEPLKIAR